MKKDSLNKATELLEDYINQVISVCDDDYDLYGVLTATIDTLTTVRQMIVTVERYKVSVVKTLGGEKNG